LPFVLTVKYEMHIAVAIYVLKYIVTIYFGFILIISDNVSVLNV
jgi:hypothetical protein